MCRDSLRRVFASAGMLVGLVLALGACSGNRVWVEVPPPVDLAAYGRVGLINFSGNDAGLSPLATRQFQQEIHAAQPGVGIVELGDAAWLMGSVGATTLNADALRAIAEQQGIDAIFLGELAVSKATPRLDVMVDLIQVRGSVDVNADLHVRLVEARGGATVWSRSSYDTLSIAHADVLSTGAGNVSVRDPEGMYAPMVANLTSRITGDFRPRYVRRKFEQVPPHYVIRYAGGDAVYAPPRPAATASASAH